MSKYTTRDGRRVQDKRRDRGFLDRIQPVFGKAYDIQCSEQMQEIADYNEMMDVVESDLAEESK